MAQYTTRPAQFRLPPWAHKVRLLGEPVAALTPHSMAAVDEALRVSLGPY